MLQAFFNHCPGAVTVNVHGGLGVVDAGDDQAVAQWCNAGFELVDVAGEKEHHLQVVAAVLVGVRDEGIGGQCAGVWFCAAFQFVDQGL